MIKFTGGLTEAPLIGSYIPQERAASPCPDCGLLPLKVWRLGGAFQQRTECKCGRVTVWVMCGHDAVPDATDDIPSTLNPEAPMANDQATGLYDKFRVERTDGSSAPGEKHHGCDYFVLDMDHDDHAYAAIAAYVASLEASGEFPALAADLRYRYL